MCLCPNVCVCVTVGGGIDSSGIRHLLIQTAKKANDANVDKILIKRNLLTKHLFFSPHQDGSC